MVDNRVKISSTVNSWIDDGIIEDSLDRDQFQIVGSYHFFSKSSISSDEIMDLAKVK